VLVNGTLQKGSTIVLCGVDGNFTLIVYFISSISLFLDVSYVKMIELTYLAFSKGPIVTNVKHLLTPQPNEEIRVKVTRFDFGSFPEDACYSLICYFYLKNWNHFYSVLSISLFHSELSQIISCFRAFSILKVFSNCLLKYTRKFGVTHPVNPNSPNNLNFLNSPITSIS
jgi:hypothetical protein